MFATFVLCKLPVGRYENLKRKLYIDNWNFFNNFELVVRNWDRDKEFSKLSTYVAGVVFSSDYHTYHVLNCQNFKWKLGVIEHTFVVQILRWRCWVFYFHFFSKHNICLFRSLQMKSFMVAETFIDGCCSNIDVDTFIRTSQLHRLWEINTSVLKNIPTSAVMHFLSTRWYCSAE